ncbi:MAG: 2,3-bisphosphoglycerate-independent phosphoglycerate mutase [Pyrinomonadaceae bacterium]
MPNKRGPLAFIILDGWGYTATREGNAIALAQTPYYDEIVEKYPQTLLETSGPRVGLPPGVMGNSEVGHLSIGSGRIIRMDVSRIDYAIETGEFFSNEVLTAAVDGVKARGTALHLMGLASDGQVHSSLEHAYALLRLARERGVQRVYLHCFLDGRDVAPSSGADYLRQVRDKCAELGVGQIATVCGRYYAMDRDKRWERIEKAYRMLVDAEGERTADPIAAVQASYERGVTDEFVLPIVVESAPGVPVATIQDGDGVIFFNFRPDRARQITRALTIEGFDGFSLVARPDISFACMTMYDETFPLPIAYPKTAPHNTLVEVFARDGISNYRMAETEKYAHVTYFFNGGVEKEFPCEKRLLVPSPKVATYDLQPEMSAFKLTNEVLKAIDAGETDVYIINFANTDMLGHTGKLDKTIEAVQYIDTCLGWITKAIRRARGACLITADHGNCEQMIDFATGQPHTAHTTNPVPFHLVDRDSIGLVLRADGSLEDMSPTILGMLCLEKPPEMTGRDLREL